MKKKILQFRNNRRKRQKPIHIIQVCMSYTYTYNTRIHVIHEGRIQNDTRIHVIHDGRIQNTTWQITDPKSSEE